MHSKRYREWNAQRRTRNDSRDRENGAMEAETTLGTPKNSLEMATLTPDVVLDAARRLRAGVGIRDRHAALLIAMCVCACLCV
jgi:hypothetical protein